MVRIRNNPADVARIDSTREYYLSHREEMLEGTDILWGEYLDYYYLMCKKQSMGDKSFYKELQNGSRSTEETVFPDIGYWQCLPDALFDMAIEKLNQFRWKDRV